MSKRLIAFIVMAVALVVPAGAHASFTLKPGQTKQYRCGPNNGGYVACVKRAEDRRSNRLRWHIADVGSSGCWTRSGTSGRSCTMWTECRNLRMRASEPNRWVCWAHNGSKILLRVWRYRR